MSQRVACLLLGNPAGTSGLQAAAASRRRHRPQGGTTLTPPSPLERVEGVIRTYHLLKGAGNPVDHRYHIVHCFACTKPLPRNATRIQATLEGAASGATLAPTNLSHLFFIGGIMVGPRRSPWQLTLSFKDDNIDLASDAQPQVSSDISRLYAPFQSATACTHRELENYLAMWHCRVCSILRSTVESLIVPPTSNVTLSKMSSVRVIRIPLHIQQSKRYNRMVMIGKYIPGRTQLYTNFDLHS